jgi:hypothetical protein
MFGCRLLGTSADPAERPGAAGGNPRGACAAANGGHAPGGRIPQAPGGRASARRMPRCGSGPDRCGVGTGQRRPIGAGACLEAIAPGGAGAVVRSGRGWWPGDALGARGAWPRRGVLDARGISGDLGGEPGAGHSRRDRDRCRRSGSGGEEPGGQPDCRRAGGPVDRLAQAASGHIPPRGPAAPPGQAFRRQEPCGSPK